MTNALTHNWCTKTRWTGGVRIGEGRNRGLAMMEGQALTAGSAVGVGAACGVGSTARIESTTQVVVTNGVWVDKSEVKYSRLPERPGYTAGSSCPYGFYCPKGYGCPGGAEVISFLEVCPGVSLVLILSNWLYLVHSSKVYIRANQPAPFPYLPSKPLIHLLLAPLLHSPRYGVQTDCPTSTMPVTIQKSHDQKKFYFAFWIFWHCSCSKQSFVHLQAVFHWSGLSSDSYWIACNGIVALMLWSVHLVVVSTVSFVNYARLQMEDLEVPLPTVVKSIGEWVASVEHCHLASWPRSSGAYGAVILWVEWIQCNYNKKNKNEYRWSHSTGLGSSSLDWLS